jgi:hypothetical protein
MFLKSNASIFSSVLHYIVSSCSLIWTCRRFVLSGPTPQFWRSFGSIVQNADFPQGDKTSRWSCANCDSSSIVLHSLMTGSQVVGQAKLIARWPCEVDLSSPTSIAAKQNWGESPALHTPCNE